MSDTFTVLRDCLVTEFDVPADRVEPGATLASLELDSLALVELSLLVEERIGATVSDIRPESTLGALAAHADAVRAAAPAAVPVPAAVPAASTTLASSAVS
ncbi:acyl carrier protein [Kitasatospora purpeofusca]|uniref:acyl carrier protein n=1 Tax=Kitasatospora purpeofusca TaxID=67352 RepID=UPI002259B12D|nr:acyl carrier protein [Kitasatospora purpeofusca]MCX4758101.1 acyl carrier protein [Kitasatospora purpeofusca]WSR31427.1 acyl carrier protein [Kitasatospora purpeofusca]